MGEFTAGNGDVCDVLEMAVVNMKKGEQAVITCTNPTLLSDEKLGLKEVKGEKILLTLTLTDFEKVKEHWSMNEEEKVSYGGLRKGVGSTLFGQGRIALALERYKKVADMFSSVDNMKDETLKSKAKDLKRQCELNKAACFLKLREYADAKKSCDAVLKDQSNNVKAMYRKAQACYEMKDIQECTRGLKRLIEIDSQNRDARGLLKRAHVAQKEEDKKSKSLFQNMCKALGRGPLPEPYKEKKADDDDDDCSMSDGEAESKADDDESKANGSKSKADSKSEADGNESKAGDGDSKVGGEESKAEDRNQPQDANKEEPENHTAVMA